MPVGGLGLEHTATYNGQGARKLADLRTIWIGSSEIFEKTTSHTNGFSDYLTSKRIDIVQIRCTKN